MPWRCGCPMSWPFGSVHLQGLHRKMEGWTNPLHVFLFFVCVWHSFSWQLLSYSEKIKGTSLGNWHLEWGAAVCFRFWLRLKQWLVEEKSNAYSIRDHEHLVQRLDSVETWIPWAEAHHRGKQRCVAFWCGCIRAQKVWGSTGTRISTVSSLKSRNAKKRWAPPP